jgi:hypothetical protein
MADDLLEGLQFLEQELHRPETRRDAERMQTLLHPDFEEFGRSGRRYTREDQSGSTVTWRRSIDHQGTNLRSRARS